MKVLVAIMLTVVLLVAFAVPVFADQPENPGFFGEMHRESAQNEDGPGVSPEVHQGQADANQDGTNLGQAIKFVKTLYCGIPPKHSP